MREEAVRKSILILSLVSGLAASTAWAQPYPPNPEGVTMGHWHLNSRDIDANKKIFVALGGTAIKAGDFDIVRFPGVNVYLNIRPGSPPASGGTVGSVVNHVGFLVPNVQDSVAKWKAAGVDVTPGSNGRTDQAFVLTSDGLRIEILEDKNQKVPIRHHHVHFFVPETAIPDMQAWYGKLFGATPGMRSSFKTAYVPGAELAFSKTSEPTVTTKGRVLDHIGFDVNNLDEFLKKAEAVAGVKPVVPASKNPTNGVSLAFIADPWGTYIELNQRPNQTYLDQM
jgi:catechol 2,3-dioxygenase-like lactoylglutathione lyase family enzyme